MEPYSIVKTELWERTVDDSKLPKLRKRLEEKGRKYSVTKPGADKVADTSTPKTTRKKTRKKRAQK